MAERVDTGHYVNSPVNEGRNNPEKSNSGWSKVFCVVGVSFGLLCIIQSALNVVLRLQGIGFCKKSDLISNVTLMSAGDISALLLETDRLVKENRELQAKNTVLTTENMMINDRLSQLQDYLIQLQTEDKRLMPPETEPIARICPPGWRQHISSCYQLSTERQTWRYAKEDCAAKGAHLVILNDQTEEEVIHSLGSSDIWIGLKAERQRQLKIWTWVDGSRVNDSKRIQPQPDDRRFYCAYSKESLNGSVTWYRVACGDNHDWVCEMDMK